MTISAVSSFKKMRIEQPAETDKHPDSFAPFSLFPMEIKALICEYFLNERTLQQLSPKFAIAPCIQFLNGHRDEVAMTPFNSKTTENEISSMTGEELIKQSMRVMNAIRMEAAFLEMASEEPDPILLAQQIHQEKERLSSCFATLSHSVLDPKRIPRTAETQSLLDFTCAFFCVPLRFCTQVNVASRSLTAFPQIIYKMPRVKKITLPTPHNLEIPSSLSNLINPPLAGLNRKRKQIERAESAISNAQQKRWVLSLTRSHSVAIQK